MADLTQVFRWQSGFVRGLAQSVLERARAIRGSLPPSTPVAAASPKARAVKKKAVRKPTPKRGLKKRAKVK